MNHVGAEPAIASSSSGAVKSPKVKKQRVLDTGPGKKGKGAANFLSKLEWNEGANSKEAFDRLKEIEDLGFDRDPFNVLDTWDDDLSFSKYLSFINDDCKQSCRDINKLDSSRLLSDVVFVISGFQNPLRSDIQKIGLSLGAQYRPDWCSEATHLICDIPNTPKYNQAKGKGIIVGMEWLFHCQMDRSRVSETYYRLDKHNVIDIRDDDPESRPSCSDKSKRDISFLLTDVVFVISGFQHPLSTAIREIGLSLGAQHRLDWCSEATHLICAIPNTPKYNQAKGKGIIVGMEWLFHCQMDRRRVSETHFRLDKHNVIDIRDDDQESRPSCSDRNKRNISFLLTDVVFVMSGFQNLLRAAIRDVGLSLGAQYRREWCAEATHLICDIPNTLKFHQAKGKGKIVRSEWLFHCIVYRCRVPETYYRLDKPKSPNQNEVQSNIKKSYNYRKPPGMSLARRRYIQQIQYAEDNEIEEERVASKGRRNTEPEDDFTPRQRISSSEGEKESLEPIEISSDDEDVPEPNPVTIPQLPDISDSETETEDINVYEAETDEESEASVIERLGLPPLPNFFSGHRFFIHAESFDDAEDVSHLYRYLVAYGGKVFKHMSQEVSFIVTKSQRWLSDFDQALFVNSKVKFLQWSWVEASSKQLKAVPKNSYYIHQ